MPSLPKISPCGYVAVDPGKSGGIAFIQGRMIQAWAMPETERDVWDLFETHIASDTPIQGVIEKVAAMPGQGITSMFTFGFGYGRVRMAMIGNKISFEEVRPQDWQRALGIPPRKKQETKDQFKRRLRAFCQQLFPKLYIWEETKTFQLTVCDAILMAEYLRRKDLGKL